MEDEIGSVPAGMSRAFTVPRHTTREVDGKQVRHQEGREPLKERVERHRRETGGMCICFSAEEMVVKLVESGDQGLESSWVQGDCVMS